MQNEFYLQIKKIIFVIKLFFIEVDFLIFFRKKY